MKKSTITATFKADIKKVWEVVTNNNKYEWRSDLSKMVRRLNLQKKYQ